MGLFFSQVEKNNRSQLDKSLIRAFSAVHYFDSTMGGFFKIGGSGDNAERVQAALGPSRKPSPITGPYLVMKQSARSRTQK